MFKPKRPTKQKNGPQLTHQRNAIRMGFAGGPVVGRDLCRLEECIVGSSPLSFYKYNASNTQKNYTAERILLSTRNVHFVFIISK